MAMENLSIAQPVTHCAMYAFAVVLTNLSCGDSENGLCLSPI